MPAPRRLLVLGLTALLALLGAAWWFSPTQRLKRRATALIRLFDIPAGTGELTRNLRGNKLADYLTASLTIGVTDRMGAEIPDEISRDQAAALFAGAAGAVREISLRDLKITSVSINDNRGHVDFRVDAIVQLSSSRPIDGIVTGSSEWQLDATRGWLVRHMDLSESPR